MSPRRREVLDEAARLFYERGYRGTSMDDVAEAVGLTKGTLYHHFPSKAQILTEIYDEATDFVLEATAGRDQNLSPEDEVRALIRGIMELIEQRRYHVTVFYQEMRWVPEWLPPKDARRVQRKIRRFLDYAESVLQRGVDEGQFQTADVHVAAYGLLGMASWTYQWYQAGGPRSLDEVTDIFASIFLQGITPR